jgi:hypothetical protein
MADGFHRSASEQIRGVPMTDSNEAVINEALRVIDKALSQMMSRELVSSGEVTDVLLDVRTLLVQPAPADA